MQELEQRTGETPKALQNRPIVVEAEHFFISCFYDLNDFRGVSEALQPLTVTDIKSYMDILDGFSIPERYRFMKVIKSLDQTYLNFRIDKDGASPNE